MINSTQGADQGITALDPTVGLLRKELEANNVPEGQEAQYFQSKGRALSPQLVFLIQANKRLQQQAMMAQARPPQTTIAQDLNAALTQQADPRQQGIAPLPVGDLGTKGMASGGIVAFAGGGTPDTEDYVDPAESPVGKLLRALGYFGTKTLPGIAHNVVAGVENVPYYLVGGPKFAQYKHPFEEADMQTPSTPTKPDPNVTYSGPPGRRTSPPSGIRALVAPPPVAPTAQASPAAPTTPRAAAPKPAPEPEDPVGKYLRSLMDTDYAQRERERRESSGWNKAMAAREAELERRKKATLDLAKSQSADKRKDFLMNLAASAFGSVGKGTTFLQGIGGTGANFARGAMDINKEYRGLEQARKQHEDLLADANLALQESRAAAAMGDAQRAEDLKDRAFQMFNQYNVQQKNLGFKGREVAADERRADTAERELTQRGQLAREEMGSRERIAKGNAEARTRTALIAWQRASETQRQRWASEALKGLDMDALRMQVAKSTGLKKPPPGPDKYFDKAVAEARNAYILNHVATITGINDALAGGQTGPDTSGFHVDSMVE